jgi:hypothetical protein
MRTWTCLVALGCAAAAQAEPSRLGHLAQEFVTRHGGEVRAVKAGPTTRPATRLFVPILPEAWEEFHDTFTEKNGAIILRFSPRHLPQGFRAGEPDNHVALAVRPKDELFWGGLNFNGEDPRVDPQYHRVFRYHGPGGKVIVADLADRLPHLMAFLAARAFPNPNPAAMNCMEWLPNAEVAPGVPLFHELGITRSHDGPNMKAKIIHSANQRVEVVGIPVRSLEEFRTMSDADLMGAPPAGGVDDAAR